MTQALHAFTIVASAIALAACGGGSDAPEPTPVPASLTVSNATNAALNGIYTTNAANLAEVVKVNPIGSEPEVCSFRFSGPRGPGGEMSGDVRYIPGATGLRVIFVAINGIEFVSRDATNAAANRINDRVDLTGKTLTASTDVASTITLTGAIPMRGNRPEGC